MSEFFHEYLPGDPRDRIKDLLRERKITQAQLAETIGISESTLNRYLSGQTEKIPVDHIVAIARFFKVSTDFLLGLRISPSSPTSTLKSWGCRWARRRSCCSAL